MAKAFGGFIRFLFVLLIIGVIGYNTYEIGRLRTEVAALKAGSSGKSASAGTPHAAGSGAMEQMAEAQSHAERASAFLKQKRFGEAATEMKAASEAAGKASGNAQAESRTAVAALQSTLTKLSSETGAMWKQSEGALDKMRAETEHEKHDTKKTEEINSDEKRDSKHP